jgi:outer membrane protein assembly factor BamB
VGGTVEAPPTVRRRWLVVLLALIVLAAGVAAAAAVVVWKHRHPGSIRGSASTEFETTEAPGATTRPQELVREIPWPTFGYDNARTHFAPDFHVRPPFRRLWEVRTHSLLEFPPVVAYGRLLVGSNAGRFLAIDAETGHIAWRKNFGRCIAASPAVGDNVVYQPLMDPSPCREHKEDAPGFMIALDADTGTELWRFRAGVIESSPLLVDGIVYFGSWDHKLYALDASTHRVRWTFTTGDKVKDGVAYRNGTVYFGSYDGKVYALDARTGKKRWSASGNENFYSTPAVAYGRVYIGNTDGRVYAYGAKSGHLLWARSTGKYVYASPAIWNKRVYAGSYDGHFYALDAGTGDVRWKFNAHGAVSGSATVIDGVVYFSTLSDRTYGLDARTGKKLWQFGDGQYNPGVADEERFYAVGYKAIYGLEPRG